MSVDFFKDWDLSHWQYWHGKPEAIATFKAMPEDFIVTETLPFELTGEGENLYLLIEKRELNTQQVCQHLAKVLGRRLRDIGYAGLKDKQSVSRQWFSVQANVRQDLDLTNIATPQIKLIDSKRHNKKLKIGNLKNNRFDIRLKGVENKQQLLAKFELIKAQGVPNYFGLQRFGFKGNNLNWANRWANGESIRDKKIKSFALSAIRSYVFNEVVSKRLAIEKFQQPLENEVFLLAGSNSYFQEQVSPEIQSRLTQQDILLSAPLMGSADKKNPLTLPQLEVDILAQYSDWQTLLNEQCVDMQRRPIHLMPHNMTWQTVGDDVEVSFELTTGSFATSVLRECVQFRQEPENENSNQQ